MIPVGNAPESFRIYEAIDAASIPVMSLDKSYTSHMCNNAFRPFIDSGAPFLYVNDWSEAVEKMDHLLKNKNLLEKMQLDLIKWRAEFWNNVTTKLECEVMTYFDKYRQDAVFLNNQSIHGKVDLKRFCGKRKLPRFPSYFSTVKN